MISMRDKLNLFKRIIHASSEEAYAARRHDMHQRHREQKAWLEKHADELKLLKEERKAALNREERERSERETHEELRRDELAVRGEAYADLMKELRQRLLAKLSTPEFVQTVLAAAKTEKSPLTKVIASPLVPQDLDKALGLTAERRESADGVLLYFENGSVQSFTVDDMLDRVKVRAAADLDKIFEGDRQ